MQFLRKKGSYLRIWFIWDIWTQVIFNELLKLIPFFHRDVVFRSLYYPDLFRSIFLTEQNYKHSSGIVNLLYHLKLCSQNKKCEDNKRKLFTEFNVKFWDFMFVHMYLEVKTSVFSIGIYSQICESGMKIISLSFITFTIHSRLLINTSLTMF